jgi:hypothetical protein
MQIIKIDPNNKEEVNSDMENFIRGKLEKLLASKRKKQPNVVSMIEACIHKDYPERPDFNKIQNEFYPMIEEKTAEDLFFE